MRPARKPPALPALALVALLAVSLPGAAEARKPKPAPVPAVAVDGPASCLGGAPYAAAVLADAPFSWWRLAELTGTTAFDCAAFARNGTYMGDGYALAAAVGTGAGYAAVVAPAFDGVNGYVTLPAIPSVADGGPFGSAFSIECWIAPYQSTRWARMLDVGNGPAVDSIVLSWDGGSTLPRFDLFLPGTLVTLTLDSSAWLPLGVWSHVVATASFNAADGSPYGSWTLSLFIAGQLRGSVVRPLNVPIAATYDPARTQGLLSKSAWPFSSPDQELFGGLAEVAIYPRALTPARVLAHFTAGVAPVAAPAPPPPAPPSNAACLSVDTMCYRRAVLYDRPTAWWRLAETSGNTAFDCAYSGKYSGSYLPGLSLAAVAGPPYNANMSRKLGVAPTFDGSTFVQLPALPQSAVPLGGPFGRGAFTVEAWVKPTAIALWARFFEAGNGPTQDSIALSFIGASLYPQLKMYPHSGQRLELAGTAPLTLNAWNHVVGTAVANRTTGVWSLRLYLNAALIGDMAEARPLGDAASDAARGVAYIGKSEWPGDALFQGSLAEVAVYDSALPAARVREHYRLTSCDGRPASDNDGRGTSLPREDPDHGHGHHHDDSSDAGDDHVHGDDRRGR